MNSFPTNPYTHEEEVVVGGGKRNKLAPIEARAGAPRAGKRAAASAAHDRVPIDRTETHNERNNLHLPINNIHNEVNIEQNQNPYGQNLEGNDQEIEQMNSNSNSQDNDNVVQPAGVEAEGATNTDAETE